jgi:hypothetical protein
MRDTRRGRSKIFYEKNSKTKGKFIAYIVQAEIK